MIEWTPLEEDGWVLATEDLELETLRNFPESLPVGRPDAMKLKFSVDIKDLRSFECVEPKRGIL